MAKGKLKMDAGAMKEFFLQHVEKIVLGVVLILVVVFVYMGSVVETFPTNKNPAQLTNTIGQATQHINTNTWEKVEKSVLPQSIDNPIVITVKADEWGMPQLDPLIKPSRSKRRDPVLYPPTKLEGVGQVIALSKIPGEEETSAIDEKYKEMLEEQQKPLNPLPLEDTKKTKKKTTRPSREGPTAGTGLEDVQLGRGGGGFGPAGPGGARTVSEEERAEWQGYRASGQSIAVTRNCIVLKALVPFQKQLEEYREALPNNVYYNEQRDIPNYIFFYVERADVTANPNADPKDFKWVALKTKVARNLPYAKDAPWEGIPEELIEPAYILPGMTLPVPPALMTDLKKLAGHPDIPWAATGTELVGGPNDPSRAKEAETPEEGPEGPESPDATFGPGGERGQPGVNSPSRGPSRPAAGPSRGPSPGREGGGRAGYPGPSGNPYGRGTPGGSFTDQAATYKLLRFVDFEVERGKKYRYRVRLTLEDPNHPAIPAMATQDPSPLPQSLDKDVEARLRELKKEEDKTGVRKFYRDTDWSEVSPVISIADPLKLAGGEVTPPRFSNVPGGKVQTADPSGKLLVVTWDDNYATSIPGEQEVERGSVLNFKKDAEALHPIKMEYVKLKDYVFSTGAIVVDFRGGEKLPGGDFKNPIYAPGEIAVVDQNGNLIVQSEATDNPLWQRYGKFEPKKIETEPGMEGYPGAPRNSGLEDALAPKPTRRPSSRRGE